MKPILPEPYAEHRVIYPAFVQPALKGTRALYQCGYFQGEEENTIELEDPLKNIFQDDIILDGVLIDSIYHVFDSVDFHKPFHERYDKVAGILQSTVHLHNVQVVETHKVDNEFRAGMYLSKWRDQGYKAMMYRLGLNKYPLITKKDNKSWSLLKRKIS